MTIEEITQRLAADKVFDLPPAGRLGTPEDLALVDLHARQSDVGLRHGRELSRRWRTDPFGQLKKAAHPMTQKKYRVIQWATGMVGKVALQAFHRESGYRTCRRVRHQSRESRQGRRRPRRAFPPTGVIATNDVEKLIALMPTACSSRRSVQDLDLYCRLLRSGKNVVSPAGPFIPTDRYRAQFDKIEAACRDGGTSYHGCGIHPGFSGDILPLTLTRLMNRIDRIEVTEIIDKLRNPMIYTEVMGFGRDPDELLAKPSRSAEAPYSFEGSMAMVVEGLGKKIEKLTTRLEVAKATKDIPYTARRGIPRVALSAKERSQVSTLNGRPGWMAPRS